MSSFIIQLPRNKPTGLGQFQLFFCWAKPLRNAGNLSGPHMNKESPKREFRTIFGRVHVGFHFCGRLPLLLRVRRRRRLLLLLLVLLLLLLLLLLIIIIMTTIILILILRCAASASTTTTTTVMTTVNDQHS